jgi:hypothetical protein
MKTAISLLSILALATPLAAQNAQIPQELPLPLRQNSDAVQRKVELPNPQDLPFQWPRKPLNNEGTLQRLWAPMRQPAATVVRVNAVSVEDRIAALEAKVAALQSELEAQTALIKQLMELVDRQQKKN